MLAKQVDISKLAEIPCECGETAKAAALNYKDYLVKGWKCKSCKKEYISPEDSLKISEFERMKKSGLKVKVAEIGQSLAIRIPKPLAEIYNLTKGETVNLRPENLKKIEIEFE
ncbi:MAG: AbrB/MazE/SpoVT family DNA-binding domain-containing protein [Candidatus Aenigmarchaeota archaeon]|nr:AbrB/MazE/SpoVT family DNA-binding domain-containing protein [Candidatus Aenigmarchaeota archaeon]